MNKCKRGSQLWIVSAILMLVALLCSVGTTGAWFTAGDGFRVECTVTVGQFNLHVYQVIGTTETRIYTNDENEDTDAKSYVDLTNGEGIREILPDTDYDLTLKLKNTDKGTDSFYIRYKINLVACGKTSTTRVLDATFSGNDSAFVYANGWYYYGTSATSLKEYEKDTYLTMCTSFSIPYSEFYENNYNGENVKIEIVVECSDITTF